VPSSWATVFWHALHHARARAIGLDDLLRLRHQEMSEPVFPFDFPDTAAGKSFCIENAERLLEHELLRPSAKRLNYLRFDHSSHPFLFPFRAPVYRGPLAAAPRDTDVLVPVRIVLVGRGKVWFLCFACLFLFSKLF
jgi:hypothetical protein